MHTNDRCDGARDERHIEVTGSMVDGGIGGIAVGGDLNVESTVSPAATTLTASERRLASAVLDAARRAGPPMTSELGAALHRLDRDVAVEPPRRARVRASLEQVALHAGTAGAILAAAQLALDAIA